MKNIDVFDFNTKKILSHSSKYSEPDRIRYLKQVIVEYKGQSGIFDTQIGVGLRMPPTLHKDDLIKLLESEIEKSKMQLFYSDSKLEKSSIQFEDALSVIDDVIDTLAENPEKSNEYLKKLQQRIQKIIDYME